MKIRLEIIVIMILFLILFFYFTKKILIKVPIVQTISTKSTNNQKTASIQHEQQPLYIKSEKTCSDTYSDCQKWADAGECEINPEYMLFACPGACKACDLSATEKREIAVKASKLPLPGCVYHGESYPGFIMPDYRFL